MSGKKISILMTTFNCGSTIKVAINSVLNQNYTNFEIIVIDDGSTDNTREIVLSFSDSRIKYYKIKHSGRSSALNIGLSRCSAEWIALIDADDLWHPQKLEKQLEGFNYEPESVLLTDSAYFKDNKIKYVVNITQDRIQLLEIFKLHGHINTSSVIFNKYKIIEYGGYDESLTNVEDYDLWLRLKDDFKFIPTPGILCYVRIRNNSLSRCNLSVRNKLIRNIQNKYYCINTCEDTITEGWRELFYGDKRKARFLWKSGSEKSARLLIAYIISFLPEKIFRYIIEARLRYFLQYVLNINKYKQEQRMLERLLK